MGNQGHGNVGHIRGYTRSLAVFYRWIDVGCILLSLGFAIWLNETPFGGAYVIAAIFMMLLFSFIAEQCKLYRSWREEDVNQLMKMTSLCWVVTSVCFICGCYFSNVLENFCPYTVGVWLTTTWVTLSLWRALFRVFLASLRRRGYNSRSAIIVGAGELGRRFGENLAHSDTLGIRMEGFYDDRTECRDGAPIVKGIKGNIDEAIELARRGEIDIIYVALPLVAQNRINQILTKCSDTTATVHIVPDFTVYNLMQSKWSLVGDMYTLSIHDSPFAGVSGSLKRLEDIVISLAILSVIALPMCVIACLIKLTSKGPVIFKQDRYGLDGRKIKVWKFRSMKTMENGDKVVQASKNDSRITPVGAFLRRTSLDELPQFINVLQGSMSIVGPRPHAVAHNEEYRQVVDRYMLRHKVKPGITGWAQINGWRGETDTVEKMERRVEHDLDYIRHWSIWMDLKIVFATVFKGFTGDNAY